MSGIGAVPKSTGIEGVSRDEPSTDIREQLPVERFHEFTDVAVGHPACASRITFASRPARISRSRLSHAQSTCVLRSMWSVRM